MKYVVLLLAMTLTGIAQANNAVSIDEMFMNSQLLFCNGAVCSNAITRTEVKDTGEHNGVKGYVIVFPQGLYTDEQVRQHSKEVADRYRELLSTGF